MGATAILALILSNLPEIAQAGLSISAAVQGWLNAKPNHVSADEWNALLLHQAAPIGTTDAALIAWALNQVAPAAS